MWTCVYVVTYRLSGIFFISCEQLKEGIAITAPTVHSCLGIGANVSIFYIITNGVRNTLWAESDEILCIQFSNIFITFISTFRNYFSREKGHIKIMTSFLFINLLVRWKCHDLGWFKNFDAKKYCIFNFRWHPFRSLLCNVLHNLNICFSLLSCFARFQNKRTCQVAIKIHFNAILWKKGGVTSKYFQAILPDAG